MQKFILALGSHLDCRIFEFNRKLLKFSHILQLELHVVSFKLFVNICVHFKNQRSFCFVLFWQILVYKSTLKQIVKFVSFWNVGIFKDWTVFQPRLEVMQRSEADVGMLYRDFEDKSLKNALTFLLWLDQNEIANLGQV